MMAGYIHRTVLC